MLTKNDRDKHKDKSTPLSLLLFLPYSLARPFHFQLLSCFSWCKCDKSGQTYDSGFHPTFWYEFREPRPSPNLLMHVPLPLAGSGEKWMEPYQLLWIYGEFLCIGCCFFLLFFFTEACLCLYTVSLLMSVSSRMLSKVIWDFNIFMSFIKFLITASIMLTYSINLNWKEVRWMLLRNLC